MYFPGLPSEYTTFYSFAYSLDLILPLVDLQQERDWAPAVTCPDAWGHRHDLIAGHITRVLMWFEILFGWSASLVLVAVLSRLVDKDRRRLPATRESAQTVNHHSLKGPKPMPERTDA